MCDLTNARIKVSLGDMDDEKHVLGLKQPNYSKADQAPWMIEHVSQLFTRFTHAFKYSIKKHKHYTHVASDLKTFTFPNLINDLLIYVQHTFPNLINDLLMHVQHTFPNLINDLLIYVQHTFPYLINDLLVHVQHTFPNLLNDLLMYVQHTFIDMFVVYSTILVHGTHQEFILLLLWNQWTNVQLDNNLIPKHFFFLKVCPKTQISLHN